MNVHTRIKILNEHYESDNRQLEYYKSKYEAVAKLKFIYTCIKKNNLNYKMDLPTTSYLNVFFKY